MKTFLGFSHSFLWSMNNFLLWVFHKHSFHIIIGTCSTYRSTLQPENDRPWLWGILNSVRTSIKPPKHVRFCEKQSKQSKQSMNTKFTWHFWRNTKRERKTREMELLTGSDFNIAPVLWSIFGSCSNCWWHQKENRDKNKCREIFHWEREEHEEELSGFYNLRNQNAVKLKETYIRREKNYGNEGRVVLVCLSPTEITKWGKVIVVKADSCIVDIKSLLHGRSIIHLYVVSSARYSLYFFLLLNSIG